MVADPEIILQELSHELMSPYCPGRTIAACPSPNARKLEDHILAEAKTGKSRIEIEEQLVDKFGSEIIGYTAPSFVLWGTLIIGMVALGGLGWTGRKWVSGSRGSRGGAEGVAVPKPSASELDALDDALEDEGGF
ncbi:MAG: cytochrome c-type biogenesis protein CcmH [Nannocystaceae bacterium]|nr:cytochrome c-type biogenesis protein CcmH [Nannocystaceae bacterium]